MYMPALGFVAFAIAVVLPVSAARALLEAMNVLLEPLIAPRPPGLCWTRMDYPFRVIKYIAAAAAATRGQDIEDVVEAVGTVPTVPTVLAVPLTRFDTEFVGTIEAVAGTVATCAAATGTDCAGALAACPLAMTACIAKSDAAAAGASAALAFNCAAVALTVGNHCPFAPPDQYWPPATSAFNPLDTHVLLKFPCPCNSYSAIAS